MVGLDKIGLKIWYAEDLERLRYEYKLTAQDTILDLGAYEGSWSERLVREYGCKAICVEPFDVIDGFKYGEVIKAAAGIMNGVTMISNDRFASSIYGENKVEVKLIDTAELVKSIGEIKICKINTEGSEYGIVDHLCSTGEIARIENLQVQFHTIDEINYQSFYEMLVEMLNRTHELTWRTPFVWENWCRKQ